ncbi:MAG: CPBP family intramembrane glutamic endopeptidase [Pseudomonadota bacterium]
MWWPILDDLSGFDGDPRSISPVYFAWLSLGAAGPSISAAITVFVFDGPTALARLLSRIVLWQVPLGWYAFALLLVPFSDLVARLLFSWISPIGIELDFSNARTLLLVVPFAFVSGAFAEELGWRGFFQPTLREDLSLLATGVVIGVVWALWHTPLFFTQVGSFVSGTGPTAQSVLFYLAFSILLSWCMAWQGEYTRQSVFLAYLFHVSVNLAIGPVLMPPTSPDAQAQLILLSSAVLFFAFVGVKCFHRKAAGAA